MAAWVRMVSFLSVRNDHNSKRLAKNVLFDYRHNVTPQADSEEAANSRVVCTIEGNLVTWSFYG
jgi:hypothetical protein